MSLLLDKTSLRDKEKTNRNKPNLAHVEQLFFALASFACFARAIRDPHLVKHGPSKGRLAKGQRNVYVWAFHVEKKKIKLKKK